MKNYIKYWQNALIPIIVSGLVLFPITASAAETIVYEQTPWHFGGFGSDGPVMTVADDFQFAETILVGNITWWGGYLSSAPLPEDNFIVILFADNGGQPGAVLQTFAVGNTALRTATGNWVNPPDPIVGFEGSPEFEYSFDLPEAFTAHVGMRYWLAIVNAPGVDAWVWEGSASLVNPGVQRSFEGGAWEPYFDNTAFRLQAAEVMPPPNVAIDIEPYNPYNRIRLGSPTIYVAILSSPTFDASRQVDRNSLTFGRTGEENSLLGCLYHPMDMNRDGLPDLLCRFQTRATGFQLGDTVGILMGRTVDTGDFLLGSDSVLITP